MHSSNRNEKGADIAATSQGVSPRDSNKEKTIKRRDFIDQG